MKGREIYICGIYIYNVGGHNERSNITVVKTILRVLGKSDDLITFVEDRKSHDLRYAIDPSKIEGLARFLWEKGFSYENG